MKKNRMHFLIFIFLIFSCEKNHDNIEKDSFYWEQTKCSDPWGTVGSDSETNTTGAITSFLKENGITNAKVVSYENTLSGNANTCDACICFNGIIISVEVEKGQLKKMKELGFKQANN